MTLKEMNAVGRKMLEEAGCQIITAREDMTNAEQVDLVRESDPDAIFCRVDRVSKEMIDAAPNLKVIAKQGVSLDNIDMDYDTHRQIYVCNAPGGNAISVAEHAILLMMMCAPRHQYVENQMHSGQLLPLPPCKMTCSSSPSAALSCSSMVYSPFPASSLIHTDTLRNEI